MEAKAQSPLTHDHFLWITATFSVLNTILDILQVLTDKDFFNYWFNPIKICNDIQAIAATYSLL